MAPLGNYYYGDEAWRFRAGMPALGSGNLKAATSESQRTEEVKTTTSPGTNGEANICGAGQPYAPELSAIFGGEGL